MNTSKFLVSAIAAATVAGVVGLSYAQTGTSPSTNSGNISDTAKSTKPAGANETAGPSTNTQTAPSGSTANSTGSGMGRDSSGRMSSSSPSASSPNYNASTDTSRNSRSSSMSSDSNSSTVPARERTARADRG